MINIQVKFKEMETIVEQVFEIFLQKNKDSTTVQKRRMKLFMKSLVDYRPEQISWNYICSIATTPTFRLYFILITVLLEKNIYCLDNAEGLYRLFPIFSENFNKQYGQWNIVFCGNKIDNLVVISNHKSSIENRYFFLSFKNKSIKEVFRKYLLSERRFIRRVTQEYCNHFEKSFGPYISQINSSLDFNDLILLEQARYFKNIYNDSPKEKRDSIESVISFYRYLVNAHPDYNFFANSMLLTEVLLFSNSMMNYILNDYHFMFFSPSVKIEDKIKYVITLKGLNATTTRLKNEDYVAIDLTGINSSTLRVELMNYILFSGSISYLASNSYWGSAKKTIMFFEKIKSQPNYPNPSLTHLTTQEALLLKNYFDDKSIELATRNNKIGAARRFLEWCGHKKVMTFDNMFFDYLSQYEEPSKTSGEAVPDEDLVLINAFLKQKSNDDHVAKLCYSIFHLCIQTEFRINQICKLTIDSLRPSAKPNQYIVYSNSKTSHGRKSEYVITNLTYMHLMDIINETESYREGAAIGIMRDYIFLYKGNVNSINVINAQKFSNYLKQCCKELNLDRTYTATNLRDTHMTKSFEYVLRNDKSDAEMSILTKHKHLDTTKNHYIEMELEKMLESTYGIIIGNSKLINPENNIVDKLSPNVSKMANVVENGCGNCKASSCVQKNPLPCLACEHFVTTIAHEKYFIKAIEGVDKSIEHAKTPHDKDDLNTVKLLYVLYLKEIYKLKELPIHDRS